VLMDMRVWSLYQSNKQIFN